MVHEEVQADVTLDKDPLQFRVTCCSFTAFSTWQYHEGLGHTHAERIHGSESYSAHDVGILGSWSVEGEAGKATADISDAVGHDLALDGVCAWLGMWSLASESHNTVTDVSHSLGLEGALEVVEDVIYLVHHPLVAVSMLDNKHNIGTVGSFSQSHILSLHHLATIGQVTGHCNKDNMFINKRIYTE